jgi:hypothetical protein
MRLECDDPPAVRPVGFLRAGGLLEFVGGGGEVGNVVFDAAGERALGFEDVFDGVADGSLAATVIGNDVGLVFDVFAGVGYGEGESAGAHDGQVDDVVADEGGFFGLELFGGEDFAEGGEFVGGSLADVLDFEVAGAKTDGLGDAFGDDSGADSAETGEREAGAVMGVEGFDLDAGFAGGKKVELAVGHDAIDIQQ